MVELHDIFLGDYNKNTPDFMTHRCLESTEETLSEFVATSQSTRTVLWSLQLKGLQTQLYAVVHKRNVFSVQCQQNLELVSSVQLLDS